METSILKICTSCKEQKQSTEFYKRKQSKDGLKPLCKICHKAYEENRIRTKLGVIRIIYNTQCAKSKKRLHEKPSYSLKELEQWMIYKTNYIDLYNNWVESGYETNKKPSIDRLDDYKGYSFDNIRLITWEENNNKAYFDRANGINNKVNKRVLQFDNTAIFINSFHSINEASRITGVDDSNIIKCCKGISNYAGGFIWEYE